MASRSKGLAGLLSVLVIVTGCLSFRVEKVTIGPEIPSAAAGLKEGRTTLAEILAQCGAPLAVDDLGGETLLIYEKKFYRGGQITLGIPMSDVTGTNINVNTYGRLWRYDTVGMVLDREMTLKRLFSVRGSATPLWRSFWDDSRPVPAAAPPPP
ncbi:MAG TPA: hypothetical protein PKH03_09590 [Syntrophales bacterium]|nr:hypothetical protein [Syntrophales bacterium]